MTYNVYVCVFYEDIDSMYFALCVSLLVHVVI